MSASFKLTALATEDLDGIWWFIAADNEDAANRVETGIVSMCRRLARSPCLGHRRPEITPLPVRFWTVPRYPNYVIVYRPETKPLQVVGILHGKQRLNDILKDRLPRP